MLRLAPILLAFIVGVLASTEAGEPVFEQSDVFVGGADGYHTYRLPVILVSPRGTILVFCEGRRFGAGDLGKIDLVLKRSLDGGTSWGDLQLLQTDPGERTKIGNASAVIDRETGHIRLIFCWNLTRAFSIKSTDDGATFETPLEITDAFRQFPYAWKYFATGHVHGIQLSNGRLVIPVWVNNVPRTDDRKGEPQNGVIYSDDQGRTYHAGGLVAPFHQVNEASVFEASDGTLILNGRAAGLGCRVVARSRDGGMTWTQPQVDENLLCPTCQASTLTLPSKNEKSRVLFSNPGTRNSRARMTVRLSYDDGRTWPVAKQITAGPAGYSDMAVGPGGMIYLAYENGNKRYSERISVARFNLEWLTDGRDSLAVPKKGKD